VNPSKREREGLWQRKKPTRIVRRAPQQPAVDGAFPGSGSPRRIMMRMRSSAAPNIYGNNYTTGRLRFHALGDC